MPVIKQARLEEEKKLRCGKTFYDAALNVYESQCTDYSPNFEETANSKKFPGFIRMLQQIPFKIIVANYDQLKIGAAYLNKTLKSIIQMDSSGKFLKPGKGKKKLIHTALAIPPPAPGHAPFPIVELISEENKTIDFKMLIELGWSYLSGAIGDEPVAYPDLAITDMAFANIHAMLSVFNKVKLSDYLDSIFKSFMHNKPIEYKTVVTICENHLTPAFLKSARTSGTEKVIADTFVAAFMLVLRAKTITEALELWNCLVTIYGSKEETEEVKIAMKTIKAKSKTIGTNIHSEDLYMDFEDETSKEEEVVYGNRAGLRDKSPWKNVFKRPADKKKESQKHIRTVSNRFYAPNLIDLFAKQYLPLYPLFSASVLDDGLQTNTHIELWWKEQRRLIKNIPDRLLWPAYYLGNLHTSLRREAKHILLHNRIPNIKYGGKSRSGKNERFCDYVSDTEREVFRPTPSKGQKRKRQAKETYDASQEEWDGQKQMQKDKKKRYMKGKVIDLEANLKDMDPPEENLSDTEEREDFRQTPSKGQKRKRQAKEAYNASQEEWDGQKQIQKEKKKVKVIDPSTNLKDMDHAEENIVVTGKRLGLGESSNPGKVVSPQAITLTNEDIDFIRTNHTYLSSDAVDAGLCLLDRKLNEESQLDVTVYTSQACRIILNGDKKWIKSGKFLTVLPRSFGFSEEAPRMAAMNEAGNVDNAPGGHFTMVSNINCENSEVNVYETFGPYRTAESLLTPSGKTLLKMMCNSEISGLKVNCINVAEQLESECGALAVALGVNLCFFAPSEDAIFRQIFDVRKTYLHCMKNNMLTYFKMAQRVYVPDASKVLFSINI